MLYAFCRIFFVLLVAYPAAYLWLGLSLRHKEHLPQSGPAILIANHNSHLDTLVLLTLIPLREIPRVRIAAAADYFFNNRFARFMAEWFYGLVPVERAEPGKNRDPLAGLEACLATGGILILFPEGTRGKPDVFGEFKPGLWHLLKRRPETPLCPVYLHGLGRSLPRGEWIPVPLFIDVRAGKALPFDMNKARFMLSVRVAFEQLRERTLVVLGQEQERDDM